MFAGLRNIAVETGRVAFAAVAGATVLLISLLACVFILICAAPRLRA
ncbi:MAG: hypothetical protein H0U98_03290 [Alphaproteobacteria bacterium]|nr:hypothetical protein [Alphaproteobacteria bacterium]